MVTFTIMSLIPLSPIAFPFTLTNPAEGDLLPESVSYDEATQLACSEADANLSFYLIPTSLPQPLHPFQLELLAQYWRVMWFSFRTTINAFVQEARLLHMCFLSHVTCRNHSRVLSRFRFFILWVGERHGILLCS